MDVGVFLAPLEAVLTPVAHGLLALSEADPISFFFSPESKLDGFVSGVTVNVPLSSKADRTVLELGAP
jgi:hypothetical protein